VRIVGKGKEKIKAKTVIRIFISFRISTEAFHSFDNLSDGEPSILLMTLPPKNCASCNWSNSMIKLEKTGVVQCGVRDLRKTRL
jgi:hypothetical protein